MYLLLSLSSSVILGKCPIYGCSMAGNTPSLSLSRLCYQQPWIASGEEYFIYLISSYFVVSNPEGRK
jgi:hypothetical protein